MNHTERLFEVARQTRGLTRELAREAVERYLDLVAEEASQGEWVTLPSIGRFRVGCYRNGGRLRSRVSREAKVNQDPGYRIQAIVHLSDPFKRQCRSHLIGTRTPLPLKDYPGSSRVQPGQGDENAHYPGSDRVQPGPSNRETGKK